MKTRRQMLAGIGLAIASWPLRASAQQDGKSWRVGFLASRRPVSLDTDMFGSVPKRLRELGYVEGKNLVIEWRFADGDYKRMVPMAVELTSLRCDAIVAEGTPGIQAAQSATQTIPIVFMGGSDLVASGFVKSLARPGGNTTGVSLLLSDTIGKQLEFLVQTVPGISRVAVLSNPSNVAHAALLRTFRDSAEKMHLALLSVEARSPQEIEEALASAAKKGANALVWITDGLFIQQNRQIADLALRYRLPSMSGNRSFPGVGGLMAYSPDGFVLYARVAELLDKIFKGANPGDLPVEQPTKLELVVSRKTAKALGITIPLEVLVIADKVIE